MEARQLHVCLVCHVGQGLVIFKLLKIVEAIIKGGVALFGLPPATFAVAINELCQIIVNVHILFFQRTLRFSGARLFARPTESALLCAFFLFQVICWHKATTYKLFIFPNPLESLNITQYRINSCHT